MNKIKFLQIMGILNVTPDSFSDGGRYITLDKAMKQVELMIKEGAHIIDVGGESTRPGAKVISLQEELDRTLPVIEKIKSECNTRISVDTSKPDVMQAAITAGAQMINDVYALRQTGALEVIKKNDVDVCLMHMQGTPCTMQHHPSYKNIIAEVHDFLQERIRVCQEAGIHKKRIIIDPGFGFGKTVENNLTLIRELSAFQDLGCPILIGASRKSTLGAILNKPVDQRLYGGLALHTIAILQGASIIRTHDVAATADSIRVIQAFNNA